MKAHLCMHSRFWTFVAAGNIFLFLITICVVYFEKGKVSNFDATLFHRNTPNWAKGIRVWRKFYDEPYDNETYSSFLQTGLRAVECSVHSTLPMCMCLKNAHELGTLQCKKVAQHEMNKCFMTMRPNFEIEELEQSLNIYSLLDTLNLWGMLGSVVIWIRMYICKEDETLPYWIQFVLGIFGSIIHCAVLQPQIVSFVIFIVLTSLMSFLSYYHRLDRTWWMSMYMLQYLFTVPNFTLLANIGTQKRDMHYIIVSFMFAIVFGLAAFGRALFDEASKESQEFAGAKNAVRVCLLFLTLMMTMGAYDDGGNFLLRTANMTSFANAFNIALLLYLLLGMLCPNNLKRVCFMDWSLRFMLSMLMMTELIIGQTVN